MAARSKVLKRCKICHKFKSLSDYEVNKGKPDHHEAICKSCNEKMKKKACESVLKV